ncbi:hypothetical protein D3C85_1012140 [compost metagenome]
MGITDGDRWQIQQRSLFGNGPAIGKHAKRRHLQLDVIQQTEWFDEANQRMLQRFAQCFQAFPGARVRGDYDRVLVRLGQRTQGYQQIAQVLRRIDVLFPMGTDDEELALIQPFALQHIRGLDTRHVVIQHFLHVRTGLDDGFRTNALGDQVTARMFGQHHIDIAQMVEHLAVQFLRHALVETTIPSFHVENRNFPTLGRNDCQTGVGIAIQQECIRLLQLEHLVSLGNYFGNGLGRGITSSTEEMIRFANLQVIEKHLIQLEVIVLPRMHQNMLDLLIQLRDHAAHLDQFRASADQRHYLKH